MHSIKDRIFKLDDDTIVYPATTRDNDWCDEKLAKSIARKSRKAPIRVIILSLDRLSLRAKK